MNNRTKIFKAVCMTGITALVGASPTLQAQDQGAQEIVLEELIVTAR